MRRTAAILLATALLAGCGASDTDDPGADPTIGIGQGDATATDDAPAVDGVAVTAETYGGCESANQCSTTTLDADALGPDLVGLIEEADLGAIAAAGAQTCTSIASDGVGIRATITAPDGTSVDVECLNEIDDAVDPLVKPLVDALRP